MGLFKQMKDMKNTLHEAPGMVQQAQQMGAQAQQMAAAQQAAAQAAYAQQATAAPVAATTTGADFEPIAGVSLEQYAQISQGLAAYNYDQTKAPLVASQHGVDEASWQQAVDGWNARMRSNPAVGQRFNALYTGRA